MCWEKAVKSLAQLVQPGLSVKIKIRTKERVAGKERRCRGTFSRKLQTVQYGSLYEDIPTFFPGDTPERYRAAKLCLSCHQEEKRRLLGGCASSGFTPEHMQKNVSGKVRKNIVEVSQGEWLRYRVGIV